MKIALLGNMCSYASSLLPELLKRGHDAELFSVWNKQSDNIGFRTNPVSNIMLHRIQFKLKKSKRYDLILNYIQPWRFKGHEIMYWQGIELKWGTSLYLNRTVENRGYYATPDIAQFLSSDSILLPRTCNIDMFKPSKLLSHDEIIVGHFWKRFDIQNSYLNRYWKKSDMLEDALSLLKSKGYKIRYITGPVERKDMPSVYHSLDVVAEEFCGLSHGMTAIESLLSGIPVVGTYNPSLVECREMNDLLINVSPSPESIAEGILKARDFSVGSASEVRQYYSANHTADVLESTYSDLL